MTTSSIPLDQVIDAMINVLKDYLPRSTPGLPEPSLSVVSVSERAVGLNHRIGTELRGAFPIIALSGVRLDALVRFQDWAADPGQVEIALANLNAQLLADRDALRSAGFLQLKLENTLSTDQVPTLNSWRKQADYRVLYEYRFQHTDGAESLIARIQIESDPEELDSPQRETTIVTDQMVRWDDKAAPAFMIRGRFNINGLAALKFFSGAEPGVMVTLTRTFDGATGNPTNPPTLTAFLAAIAGSNPPDRHSRITLPLKNFLDNFTSIGDPVLLGDWDANNIPDSYTSLVLPIDPAILLPSVFDRLEITCQGNVFDKVAVLYLRALSG